MGGEAVETQWLIGMSGALPAGGERIDPSLVRFLTTGRSGSQKGIRPVLNTAMCSLPTWKTF